jgi:hypothetical protein
LPAEATCAFNPLSVSPSDGTPVTGTLTITTTAASAALRTPPPTSLRLFYAFMIPGLGIVFGVAARHKLSLRGSTVLGTFAVLLLLGTLISCGSNSTTTTTPNSGTPPGTNSVTVKASTGGSGAVSHNAMLTITITQ